MLILAPTANAEEKDEKDENRPYIPVEIQPGDTLWQLLTHGTTYVRIFNANEFITNPDVINPGDKVRIPTADEQLPRQRTASCRRSTCCRYAPSSAAKAQVKHKSSIIECQFFSEHHPRTFSWIAETLGVVTMAAS